MRKGAKCRARVRKFGAWSGKVLGPIIGPQIPLFVMMAEKVAGILTKETPNLVFGGHEKRALVWNMIRDEARATGHAVYDDARPMTEQMLEDAARAAIQEAVFHMRNGMDVVSDWTDFDQDVAEVSGPEFN